MILPLQAQAFAQSNGWGSSFAQATASSSVLSDCLGGSSSFAQANAQVRPLQYRLSCMMSGGWTGESSVDANGRTSCQSVTSFRSLGFSLEHFQWVENSPTSHQSVTCLRSLMFLLKMFKSNEKLWGKARGCLRMLLYHVDQQGLGLDH